MTKPIGAKDQLLDTLIPPLLVYRGEWFLPFRYETTEQQPLVQRFERSLNGAMARLRTCLPLSPRTYPRLFVPISHRKGKTPYTITLITLPQAFVSMFLSKIRTLYTNQKNTQYQSNQKHSDHHYPDQNHGKHHLELT